MLRAAGREARKLKRRPDMMEERKVRDVSMTGISRESGSGCVLLTMGDQDRNTGVAMEEAGGAGVVMDATGIQC